MSEKNVSFEAIARALMKYEDALTVERPADLAAFIHARVALAKSVNVFVAGERERVNDLALLGVSQARQAEQQALYKALVKLRMSYSIHIARWDNNAIAASWAGYRHDSVELVTAMRTFLHARNAAQATVTRLAA